MSDLRCLLSILCDEPRLLRIAHDVLFRQDALAASFRRIAGMQLPMVASSWLLDRSRSDAQLATSLRTLAACFTGSKRRREEDTTVDPPASASPRQLPIADRQASPFVAHEKTRTQLGCVTKLLLPADSDASAPCFGKADKDKAIRRCLVRAGLLTQPAPDAPCSPTSCGIAWCMMNPTAQMHVLVAAALAEALDGTEKDASKDEAALQLLVWMLGLTAAPPVVGFRYPVAGDSQAVYKLMIRLSDFGAVYAYSALGPSGGRDLLFSVSPQFLMAMQGVGSTHGRDGALHLLSVARGNPHDVIQAACSAVRKGLTAATEVPANHLTGASRLQAMTGVTGPSDASADGPCRDRVQGATTDMIMTETNFRVYVYLGTQLQEQTPLVLRLIDQFAERDFALPNFAVYDLTRASVIRAVTDRGLSVDTIVQFLTDRAHPMMSRDPTGRVVPAAVIEQLRLWESEAKRARWTHQCTLMTSDPATIAHLTAQLAAQGGVPLAASPTSLLVRTADHQRYFSVASE